jgi:sugar lactone lactonase YvrE
VIYVFGRFLVVTAYRLAKSTGEHVDPSRNKLLLLVERFVPSIDESRGDRVFIRENGRRLATPILGVPLVVASTAVIFALDSIPAILAVTDETFIVLAANVFAVLGLRALHFVIVGMLDRRRSSTHDQCHRPGGPVTVGLRPARGRGPRVVVGAATRGRGMAGMVEGRGRARRRRSVVAAVGIASALVVVAPAVALESTDIIRTYAADIQGPVGIAVAPDGRVVVPEPTLNRVRVISPTGVVGILAGTGVAGFSGDGGQAASAQINGPRDSAFDGAGNIYIADRDNDRIRRISPDGIITTVAGSGVRGFAGDGGPAVAAQLNNPVGVAVDAGGNIYIADSLNLRIRKVDTSGNISTFAGNGASGVGGDGGLATGASFVRPDDVRINGLGSVLIVDSGGHNVRSVATDGKIATIAGTGEAGNKGDGGPATAATLTTPIEIAFDPFNNLYISDTNGQRIRRVNTAGVISTIAGTGEVGFSGDGGPAGSARLSTPSGVSLNAAGDLFIADGGNNRIRVITNPQPFSPPGTGGGRLDVPAGSAQCKTIPARTTTKGDPGRVKLSAEQLLINQRIAQAAVRRVNAVQSWLDAGLTTNDLCGGAFVAQSFAGTVKVGSTSTLVPEASKLPSPRPVNSAKPSGGNVKGVKLEAAQLLIGQRISQAAVRRANALTARLDGGLTGGDLRSGVVTPAKLAVGLTIVSSVPGSDPARSKTNVTPAPPRTGASKVTLSANQLLINQRIAQAAVRRSNALVDRLSAGFSAADFQAATVTQRNLASALRP